MARAKGPKLSIFLTSEKVENLGLANRANFAKKSKADRFLRINCNAFDGYTRGTETPMSPISSGNNKHSADEAFAHLIQAAVFNTIKSHDPKAKDRGVKDQKLGVLRDASLGTKARGCMVELEFLDVSEVDLLINIGPQAIRVRQDIAKAIAEALVSAL